MDGSMGEELADRGFSTRDGLWSAQALVDYPGEVASLHKEYLTAGAQIITTNTYSTIPSYLDKAGMSHRMRELATLAGYLARAALDESGSREGRIAGCLPPLDESYRPDLVPPAHEAIPVYRELIDSLASYVDLFLAETMSSIDEAMHVAEALRESQSISRRFEWMVSFTLDDRDGTKLRSGETINTAVDAILVHEPIAVLFNCTTPQSVLSGIECAKKVASCRLGGYPNRFKPVPEEWTLDDDQEIVRDAGLTPESFVGWSNRFVEAGATYLGGCCGIGPSYIDALARHLDDWTS